MVLVEFGKGDFGWIGLIVVLFVVGYAYAYGGDDPAVMGHSADEVDIGLGSVLAYSNDAENQTIANVARPIAGGDVVNKDYADFLYSNLMARISDLEYSVSVLEGVSNPVHTLGGCSGAGYVSCWGAANGDDSPSELGCTLGSDPVGSCLAGSKVGQICAFTYGGPESFPIYSGSFTCVE